MVGAGRFTSSEPLQEATHRHLKEVMEDASSAWKPVKVATLEKHLKVCLECAW